MAYNISIIEEECSVPNIDIKKFLRDNKIRVTKDGSLSQKSYQKTLEFFKAPIGSNDIYVLNGHKIKVNEKPYFESKNQRVSIFQNDAISFLKSLPDSSVDVITTDPAYSGMNQRLKLGSGKIIGKYADAGKDDAKWFEEFHDTEENYRDFLKECFRVLKNNSHIYIMFDSYSLLSLGSLAREIFEVKNVLCWDKANIGLGHYFRRRHEFILFASKGKRPLNLKSIPDVWKIKRVTSAKYPTQKPTEIFELMLKGSASENFVICDPFLGSGSAAIAAIKSNCKFIGCDISTKSLNFSKERIENYLKDNIDIHQKGSLVSDDEAMIKLLSNGKPK